MTPPRPNEDKPARLRAAALVVFARTGVHGTAVPAIAEQAGVSVGTLYRYFEHKEALVNAVFRDTKQRLAHRLMSELDVSAPSRAIFDTLWARLSAFAQEEPDAFQFLEMQDHDSYLDPQSRALELGLLAQVRQLIQLGQTAGLIRSDMRPEIIMALFWGAFVGLFKAARRGYLQLTDTDISQARDACWQSLQTDQRGPGK
ncbi:MAG: TetR family transcriptional regulator [Marinobacter sp.]|nr:TetR family transcriptional regulator [Marinobacter sp.]